MSQPNHSSSNGYIGENFFTLAFDVALDAANAPPANAFDVTINGAGVTVTAITIDSSAHTVALTFSGSALSADDTIDFTYSDPTAGNDANAIQGLDGADTATFSASTTVTGGRPSAPPPPVLSEVSDSGTLGDHLTNVATPTITGTAAANNTVYLYDSDGDTVLGTAVADGSGNWSIVASTLTTGDHTLTVTQVDSFNSTSLPSGDLVVHIDTTAPATPSTPALAAGSDSGVVGDGITNDATPTLTGTAEAGSTVTLYDGATMVGTSIATGGTWCTSPALIEGDHTITAVATDAAGNVSAASSGFTVAVDTIGPTGLQLSATTVSSNSATSGSTLVTLSATDAHAITYGFAVGNGTIDADNGKFTISGTSLEAAQSLTAGTYHIYLHATDAAGNDAFQIFSLNVVDTPPNPPLALSMSSASDTGTSNSDHITSNATPTFTGTAEAGSTVRLYDTDGTTALGTATANGSGAWSIVSALSEGDHTLTAKAIDAAGNVSPASSGLAVTIDATAPTAVISTASTSLHAGETTQVTITFNEPVSGLGAADLAVDHGTLSNPASTDGGTTWTATLTPAANQVAATNHIVLDNTGVQDLAGNVGTGTTSSASYAIDTTPVGGDPTPPPVVVVTTPNGNEVTGNADNNLIASSGGADTVSAGAGDDTVAAGSRNDILQGNIGEDSISAGAGDDVARGGQDGDLVHGNTGNDMVFGDKGVDTVLGGQGDDTIQGNQGNDYVSGDIGHDAVFGGQGDDLLFGRVGDDFLSGDLGNDTLTGGTGADAFRSFAGSGIDLVADFNRAEGDRVVLEPGTSYTVSQVGADVHIDMRGGGELILSHVQLSSLTDAWIVA